LIGLAKNFAALNTLKININRFSWQNKLDIPLTIKELNKCYRQVKQAIPISHFRKPAKNKWKNKITLLQK